MKALSVRQPWAWLIVAGHKDIENRSWPTRFRGRIYVHASRTFDNDAMRAIELGSISVNAAVRQALYSVNRWHRGVLIGEVDIVDCVTQSSSSWFTGPHGFVLANPHEYDRPIPCKGRLRLFEPEIPTLC